MGRILAFDYGRKRIGMAVTDPLQIIANTMDTVANAEVLDVVKKYCQQEDVEAFVVGYPYAHGHTENEIAKDIDVFIQNLNQLFPDKKVHKVDESFTSLMASRTLLQSGVNKKERRNKGHIDAISANIILQSYLEMKR